MPFRGELKKNRYLARSIVPSSGETSAILTVCAGNDCYEHAAQLTRNSGRGSAHALGLLLVREKRWGEALDWLGAAARRGPGHARYGYVYAIALHDARRQSDAETLLQDL